MYDYRLTARKLDSKGIVDAKILFTISTLANFAKQNLDIPGVVNVEERDSKEYQEVLTELDKIIDISLELINQLDEEDRTACSVNHVNEYIMANCSKLVPDLLAFYIAMMAFTESSIKEKFDDRIEEMRTIKSAVCSGHIIDILGMEGGCSLDGSMWQMSESIINLIKGNK